MEDKRNAVDLPGLVQASLENGQNAALFASLVAAVNHLLVHDFPALVQVLYRMDISEAKLKQTLADRPDEDAAKLMATMMIERERQKQYLRQSFPPQPNVPEDEQW